MQEPNEKMDALLKACAKRRQEEAGTPLELHPATRQILQAEVSRAYPQSIKSEKSNPNLFAILWPRLIFGGAFLAALIAAFFLILSPKSDRFQLTQNLGTRPAAEKPVPDVGQLSDSILAKDSAAPTLQLDSKKEPESLPPPGAPLLAGNAAAFKLKLEKNSPDSATGVDRADRVQDKTARMLLSDDQRQKESPSPAEPDPARRSPVLLAEKEQSRNATVESLARKPSPSGNAPSAEPQLAKGNLGQLSTNAPVALAMKPAPSGAAAPQPENNRAAGVRTRAGNMDLYYSAAPSPTNLAPAEKAAVTDGIKSAADAQRFVQIDLRGRYRRNFQSPPTPKILTAFNLERDGNKIRITDADGSIYEGELVAMPASLAAAAPEEKSARGFGRSRAMGEDAISFRVTGVNKTLQEPIVFAGVLEPTTTQSAFGAIGGGGTHDESLARKKDLDARTFGLSTLSPAFSIRGKASIGATTEFSLEAVPATP